MLTVSYTISKNFNHGVAMPRATSALELPSSLPAGIQDVSITAGVTSP
jgi:hypothetical protein